MFFVFQVYEHPLMFRLYMMVVSMIHLVVHSSFTYSYYDKTHIFLWFFLVDIMDITVWYFISLNLHNMSASLLLPANYLYIK